MGLFDKIRGLFGRGQEYDDIDLYEDDDPLEKRPLSKQVYEGVAVDLPEFAQGVPSSEIIDVCMANNVCDFTPHIEYKKIFTTRQGFDGNLETEYEGIACDCGAIKKWGMFMAKQDGYLQPYRYTDLNHIYRCCCGRPRLCPFYQMAHGENKELTRSQKKLKTQE